MNYKIRRSLVVVVLILGALMTSAFSFENQNFVELRTNKHQIVPYWDNADYVNLGLSMASGRANCTLNVIGKSNTTKIVADLQLYRINSNGSLAEAGDWSYTSSSTIGSDAPVYIDNYTGYLYSQGRTALWNGTSYTTATTTASPNAKVKSNESIAGIRLNSSGETFGSSLFIANTEDEPDLILARGIDGTEGYVKKLDLYKDMAESPEAAVIFMNSKESNKVRVIPLYDSEGEKIIGKFEITPPTVYLSEK